MRLNAMYCPKKLQPLYKKKAGNFSRFKKMGLLRPFDLTDNAFSRYSPENIFLKFQNEKSSSDLTTVCLPLTFLKVP
jgi:hypothetical protein